MLEESVDFGKMLSDPTSENAVFSDWMVKGWSEEHHVENSIPKVQFLWSSTMVIQSRFGAFLTVSELENCVYWIVSLTDFTIEIFWNQISKIILNQINDAFSCTRMIVNMPQDLVEKKKDSDLPLVTIYTRF